MAREDVRNKTPRAEIDRQDRCPPEMGPWILFASIAEQKGGDRAEQEFGFWLTCPGKGSLGKQFDRDGFIFTVLELGVKNVPRVMNIVPRNIIH